MQGVDPRTDGELLVASRQDPEAFTIFSGRHERGIFEFFRRRVGGTDTARELTSRTFAAAFEASPRYELRPEPARGWLYGIAWIVLDQERRALEAA
jgi:DNA-directed RNA polymerase specialized sigma24 family protein